MAYQISFGIQGREAVAEFGDAFVAGSKSPRRRASIHRAPRAIGDER